MKYTKILKCGYYKKHFWVHNNKGVKYFDQQRTGFSKQQREHERVLYSNPDGYENEVFHTIT